VFFFIVKPVAAMMKRFRSEPIDEGMPDKERRRQELLTSRLLPDQSVEGRAKIHRDWDILVRVPPPL